MPVSSTINREQYSTDGVTVAYAIHFAFFEDTDANAIFVASDGTVEPLALNTDFTVAVQRNTDGDYTGGVLTTTSPLAGGGTITIYRAIPATQEARFVEGDPVPASTLNNVSDRAVILAQQNQDSSDRALTFPVTIAPGVSAELPNPVAGSVLGWNGTADALENKNIPAGTAVYASISTTRAGVATSEAVTPDGAASLWQQGQDIASAATLAKPADANLGGVHRVTGNVTIGNFWAGIVDGEEIELRFTGTPNLTVAGNLLPPNSAAFQTIAGDMIRWRWDATASKWRAYSGMRADGTALKVADASVAAITSGTINGAAIGGTTPSTVVATEFRGALTASVPDDTAINITPPRKSGILFVTSENLNTAYTGAVKFNAQVGGDAASVNAGANFAVDGTLGTLAGTTGTDNRITCRANSDGKIYVENRSGSAVVFALTFIG